MDIFFEEKSEKRKFVTEQAQEAIGKTLNAISLKDYFPQEPRKKMIAILGAGVAIEAVSFTSYFTANDFEKPHIVAFDQDAFSMEVTERLVPKDLDFKYRKANIVKDETFDDEQYDMIIVRNPNVHASESDWKKIFSNGFKHLKQGGVFLATTDIHQDFIRNELKAGGKIVREYEIPDVNKVGPYFNESNLFIAIKTNQ